MSCLLFDYASCHDVETHRIWALLIVLLLQLIFNPELSNHSRGCEYRYWWYLMQKSMWVDDT